MNLGFVGCGAQGAGVLLPAAVAEGHRAVVGCDPDEGRRAALGAIWPAVEFVPALSALWGRELDAVIVALPGFLHARVVDECLDHDLHVLVEKPPGANRSEVASSGLLAREHDLVCAVGMNFRYCDGVLEMRNLLSGGEYGRPAHVNIVHRSRKPLEPMWAGASLMESLFFAQGIHALDLARFFLGELTIESSSSLDVKRGAAARAIATNRGGVTCEVLFSSSSSCFSHRVEILTDSGSALSLEDLSTLNIRDEAGSTSQHFGARTHWRRSPLATGYGPAGYGAELRAFGEAVGTGDTSLVPTCDDMLVVYDLYNSIADGLGERRL